MTENIIQAQGRIIIINGGDPLPNCPASWDEAHKWADVANEEKSEYGEPLWKFDCGFKLDYDGPYYLLVVGFTLQKHTLVQNGMGMWLFTYWMKRLKQKNLNAPLLLF